MEHEINWDNEVASENDEKIARLEADIAEMKALLNLMSHGDEHFFLGAQN